MTSAASAPTSFSPRHRAENVQGVGGTEAWQRLAELAEELSDDPDEHTQTPAMNELYAEV